MTIALQSAPSDAGERWREGKYDVMYEFLAELAGSPTDETTVVDRSPGGYTDYLGLDSRRAPLDDPRVRRAIAHAIDRSALPRSLGGVPVLTGGLVPPEIPGHSHRVAPAHDRGRACALLTEAGYPGGSGLAAIELAHFGVQAELAATIVDHLSAVGIRATHLPAYSTVELRDATENAHAWIWAWGYDYPDPIGGLIVPLLREHRGIYRDDRLERLLRAAADAGDQDDRLALCREFERIWIGENAAVVPLAYNDSLLWRRPWVTGLWRNALARATFAEAVVSR